jgi:hypothetical protein
MPNVMQEACQFHSLAVNRRFSDVETIFQRKNIIDVVKIPSNWKFSHLTLGAQR